MFPTSTPILTISKQELLKGGKHVIWRLVAVIYSPFVIIYSERVASANVVTAARLGVCLHITKRFPFFFR